MTQKRESSLEKLLHGTWPDLGLLILRLAIGASMAFLHGWGKISGGPARWERIGQAMGNLGIDFAPVFWGFMAGFAEFFCSLLLMVGLAFRPAAFMLAFTMFVAGLMHLNMPPENDNAGLLGASHALELMAVYVALFFIGPGRFSLSAWLQSRRSSRR